MSTLENTTPKIPYIRREGLLADYNADTFKDTIYFATDTQQIFYNGKDFSSYLKDGSIDEEKLNEALREKINSVESKIEEVKNEIIDGASQDFDTFEEVETWINKHEEEFGKLKNDIAESLGNVNIDLAKKVSWSDDNHNIIVLPNNGKLVGTSNPEDEDGVGEIASLITLDKFNIINLGSTKHPINFNGPADDEDYRPTFNDSHKLVIDTDIETLSSTFDKKINDLKNTIIGEDLSETFDTLQTIQSWIENHGTEYEDLVKAVDTKVDTSDFEKYKTDVTSEIDAAIKGIELTDYATNESVDEVKNELLEDILILLSRIQNIEAAIMPE